MQIDCVASYTLRDTRVAEIREIMDTFDLVGQVLERGLSAVLTGKPAGKS